MKAIDPDPAKRWQEPKELGKALAAYMQRNSINDTPITIYTPIEAKPGMWCRRSPPPLHRSACPARGNHREDTQDETLPEPADAADLLPHQMSDEVSQIMDEADALIAHEVPQTAVTPEPEENSPDRFSFAQDEEDNEPLPDNSNEPFADAEEEKRLQKEAKKQERRQKAKKAATAVITLVILAAIGAGLFWVD